MNNKNKLFITALLLLSSVTWSFAQVNNGSSATATATATIITPISISNNGNLNFGNIAVNTTAGGTVQIAATTAGTRTATGGVTLPATTGSPASAIFNVAGQASYTYAISLPAAPITISDGGGNSMTVSTFTSSSKGILTGGTETVYVGATLNVGVAQPAGTYVSGSPFTVMVNYN